MKEVTPRESFDSFKPESCVFVISVDANGKPGGMVAGWKMKCSISPPLFAVCLSKQGHTHTLIQKSKEFVIAVPNKTLENEVEYFGSTHGDEVDKFEESSIRTVPSKLIKSPLLKDATANLECKLYQEIETGDHIMFIGEVVAAHINEDKKVLLNMGKVDGKRTYQEF